MPHALSIIADNWRETWHYFLLFQTYLMQRHLVYKKHSSHAYFVQRMAEHTKYCHKHLLLWGKKSGWRFRERFLFQTCCTTDGSPAFVSLFTHTFHQGKMLPLRTRLFLLPAFFLLLYLNTVPHYEAPIQLLGMVLWWPRNLTRLSPGKALNTQLFYQSY